MASNRTTVPGADAPVLEDDTWVLWCSGCNQRKPLGDFHRNAGNRNRGYHNYCKGCSKAYVARKYPNGKPGRRSRDLQKAYGLSAAEYDAMAMAQDGKCAICQRVPERLVVDHDHETGAVRGLLCHTCNRALGLLGDTADILTAALAYLVTGESRG